MKIYGKLNECVNKIFEMIDFENGIFPDFDFAASVPEDAETAEAAYKWANGWFGCKNIAEHFDCDTISVMIAHYGGGGIESMEIVDEDDKQVFMSRLGAATDDIGYGVLDPNDFTVFDVKKTGKETKMEEVTEVVETCPFCDGENTFQNWDVKERGYIATCKHCNSNMFLCDECYHADDNMKHKCDWHEEIRNGAIFSCCMRGAYKTRAREFYYITIYADTTDWYTSDELCFSNMVDIKVPRELAYKWYAENPGLKENTEEELGQDHCSFEDWLYSVSTCDDTDGLFQWLIKHGYTPKKEEAKR